MLETEAGDVGQSHILTQGLEQPKRYKVLRLGECILQTYRPHEVAPKILWSIVGSSQRRIVDQRGGGVAVFQSSAVQKWFEVGAGLALGLRNAVERIGVEIVAARQRQNGAVVRVQRH